VDGEDLVFGPALDLVRHDVAHDRLVRSHALSVQWRQHQPPPRQMLAALEQQH
jgi:hypothetical protein